MEKFRTQFLLEAPNLLTERRLGDADAPGSPPEVEFLRNGHEVPEQTETDFFHMK